MKVLHYVELERTGGGGAELYFFDSRADAQAFYVRQYHTTPQPLIIAEPRMIAGLRMTFDSMKEIELTMKDGSQP